jgi:hypothetical protein
MSSSEAEHATAKALAFDDTMMWVTLRDGRVLGVPLDWYPRLLNAAPEQRRRYWIGYSGEGLHWDELDEDISVPALLEGKWDNTRQGRAHREAEAEGKASLARQAIEAARMAPAAE